MFFMKEGERLVTHRYNTLFFSLNSSPVILNFVIKYHINKFSKDKCSKML